MSVERAGVGPLQLVFVGFETTERFRGDSGARDRRGGARLRAAVPPSRDEEPD